MRIWLDDERPMPPEYDTYCRTAEEAIELLKTNQVTDISLDHDLGTGYSTGYEVAKWIEENAINGTLKPIQHLHVHSQNPVGKQNIKMALRNAKLHWMGESNGSID